MPGSGSDAVARVPLFERLVDNDGAASHEARPYRIHDRQGLLNSVRNEVSRLLNTRCPRPEDPRDLNHRTVLDYGIPDFSPRSAVSETDRQRLGDIIAKTVAAYEPRLSEVRVTLDPDPSHPLAALGRMEAVLRIGTFLEPVSFLLAFDPHTGAAAVRQEPSEPQPEGAVSTTET